MNDQYVTPTYVPTLAGAISEAIERRLTGIFHIAVDKCVSRYQFMQDCVSLLGLDSSLLKQLSINDIKWKARRPINSCLNVEKSKDEFKNIDLDYSRTLAKFTSDIKSYYRL